MANGSSIQGRHMHEARLYPGDMSTESAMIIGFSEGVVGLADDPEILGYLANEGHVIREVSRDLRAIGSLSTRHIEIIPPLTEDSIPKLVETILSNRTTPYMPEGLVIVDNRHGEIPSDRSLVSGPILGSHF